MTIDDLPLIRCRPTPSDAELEADRDRQHARDCADYDRRMAFVVDWPVGEVQG